MISAAKLISQPLAVVRLIKAYLKEHYSGEARSLCLPELK